MHFFQYNFRTVEQAVGLLDARCGRGCIKTSPCMSMYCSLLTGTPVQCSRNDCSPNSSKESTQTRGEHTTNNNQCLRRQTTKQASSHNTYTSLLVLATKSRVRCQRTHVHVLLKQHRHTIHTALNNTISHDWERAIYAGMYLLLCTRIRERESNFSCRSNHTTKKVEFTADQRKETKRHTASVTT